MAGDRWMYRACVLCLLLVSSISRASGAGGGPASGLSFDYYSRTCPQVEQVIKAVMVEKQREAFVTAAGTLRIFFHDCFVSGCDASVLVASTLNNKAEKDAEDNLSLPGDGFDAVLRAKIAVEKVCPGVVSCADILAITTRDLVGLVGGPFWPVLKGRKDARVSKASMVAGNLPQPNMSVDQLTRLFQQRGFSRDEMVILSGAHTVGFAHCEVFLNRIYGVKQDPTINRTFAQQLRFSCPNVNLDPTVVAFNDVTTPKKFDNVYFSNLQHGLGLMASDQILWTDARTRSTVAKFAQSQASFFNAWVLAMQKLSLVGVKTGDEGEVRRRCEAVN
ncbi:hypothetical protein L7F22_060542 [Adiantum nelumboides]|nr:hypothetical protein [Adiantum nelumboides]